MRGMNEKEDNVSYCNEANKQKKRKKAKNNIGQMEL